MRSSGLERLRSRHTRSIEAISVRFELNDPRGVPSDARGPSLAPCAQSLLRENADLRQQLQEVRHAADRVRFMLNLSLRSGSWILVDVDQVSDENQALLSRIAGLERRVAQQSQQEDKGAQERFKSVRFA